MATITGNFAEGGKNILKLPDHDRNRRSFPRLDATRRDPRNRLLQQSATRFRRYRYRALRSLRRSLLPDLQALYLGRLPVLALLGGNGKGDLGCADGYGLNGGMLWAYYRRS